MSKKLFSVRNVLATTALVGMLFSPVQTTHAASEADSIVKLRIMETTDIHMNLVNYDYYQDKADDTVGLAKTATLIKKARAQAKNSMLFDNGDLLQGTPLGDVIAKVNPLKDGETHPAYKAMNLLDYDAGNIGNHEFNFGLDFLTKSLKGSEFPYVNSNVYIDDKDKNPDNDKNYFTPYKIIDKKVVDESGKEQTIKVGVIGFVPPNIMSWDQANLEGKVIAKGIIESANKFVPQMKAEGADIIVAIPHSGFGSVDDSNKENAAYQLSKVEGIDAILFGHSHVIFPDASFKAPMGDDLVKAGVDLQKGTINGVAAVEPGYWGNNLGIIDMEIERVDGKWKVKDSNATVRPIYDTKAKKSLEEADKEILAAVKEEHDETLIYIRGEIGKTSAPINSYFSLVQDDPSVQLVSNAQKWYVEHHVQGTELEGLPILSAAAPFKAGGKGSGYTDIKAGTLAIKNMADLYVYPNTLNVVLVKGSDVKDWLERSAGQFNTIDLSKTEEQPLINGSFQTYNFDVIDGITYQVDPTQPSKYDNSGKAINPTASRIVNLQYNGAAIDPEQKFLVATNNYRASGGGSFAGLNGKQIVIASPDENRQIIIDYIRESGTINPTMDKNWSFVPFPASTNVTYETSTVAKDFAPTNGSLTFISEDAATGLAKYKVSGNPVAPTNVWQGMKIKPNQVGAAVVKQASKLYQVVDGKQVFVRDLKANERYRVYGEVDGSYNLGSGYVVAKADVTYYQLPSESK